MLILGVRTDKPEAELCLYEDTQQLAEKKWEAHRRLGETIHLELEKLLNERKKSLHDIEGVAIYKGPGSFTGLRLGISVANAIADSMSIPICGFEGEDWLNASINRLLGGDNDKIVLPEYGAPVHITQQKK